MRLDKGGHEGRRHEAGYYTLELQRPGIAVLEHYRIRFACNPPDKFLFREGRLEVEEELHLLPLYHGPDGPAAEAIPYRPLDSGIGKAQIALLYPRYIAVDEEGEGDVLEVDPLEVAVVAPGTQRRKRRKCGDYFVP